VLGRGYGGAGGKKLKVRERFVDVGDGAGGGWSVGGDHVPAGGEFFKRSRGKPLGSCSASFVNT